MASSKHKLSTITALVILLIAIVTLLPKTVSAQTNGENWSWSTAKPTVFTSSPLTDMASSICPNTYKLKNIAGETDSRKICGVDGNFVNFGIYYKDYSYQPFVGFSFDDKMYKVNGICGQFDNCLYLPGSDTLVTKQNLINGMVRSLVVYKNFTHRLTKFLNIANLTTEYNFNASNPDYIFQSSDGYAWPIGNIGASSNGKWLAIEFRQRGIGLLDIDTLNMKRISTMVFNYGTGYDPISELAVSNDGQHVAVMGLNVSFTIFDNISSCGDEITDDRMNSITPIAQPCSISPTETRDFVNGFVKASRPSFNEDGGELDFYALSYTGEALEISLRAAGYGGQRLDYLALGDSYSSGEGESYDGFYLKGTNDEFEKCHVSTRSYPFLIAGLSGIDQEYMRSVACSGATMVDLVGLDGTYLGQDDRLGKNKINFNPLEMLLAQTEARHQFLPGRIYQESFVKDYQPKTITVGVGGNDIGFVNKLMTCLGPDTCNWAADPQKKEQAAIEIKSLFNTLVNTYSELHAASPNTMIYAVGYPKIIDENNECSLLIGFLLNPTERKLINEGITYLNQVIAAAAQKVGIRYLDIQDSYGDHVLCNKSQSSAMNAVRLGDDIAIISPVNWFKVIGQESFHPNSLGHYYAAQSIFNSIGNILSYNNCANGDIVCPKDIAAPEPSTYWIPGIYHNYPLQKSANFISDRQDNIDNRQKQITLADSSLEPNSSVNIEVNSTPQTLGHFNASASGSLDVGVDLPIDLDEGYHTVHIYGTSYSGELIDLYQVIKYIKPVVATTDQPVQHTTTDNVIANNPNSGGSDAVNSYTSQNTEVSQKSTEIAKPTTSTYTDTYSKPKNAQFEIPIPSNTQSVMGASVTSVKNSKTSPTEVNPTNAQRRTPDYEFLILLLVIGSLIAFCNIKKHLDQKLKHK